MIRAQDHPAASQCLLIEDPRSEAVTGQAQRARQVVSGVQGPRVVRAEMLLEAFVGILTRSKRLLKLAERPQVGGQPARRPEGMRMVRAEDSSLPLQYGPVEFAGLGEAA